MLIENLTFGMQRGSMKQGVGMQRGNLAVKQGVGMQMGSLTVGICHHSQRSLATSITTVH